MDQEFEQRMKALSDDEKQIAATCIPDDVLFTELWNRYYKFKNGCEALINLADSLRGSM